MTYLILVAMLMLIWGTIIIGAEKYTDRMVAYSDEISVPRGVILDGLGITIFILLLFANIHVWWMTLLLLIPTIIIDLVSAHKAGYIIAMKELDKNLSEEDRQAIEIAIKNIGRLMEAQKSRKYKYEEKTLEEIQEEYSDEHQEMINKERDKNER